MVETVREMVQQAIDDVAKEGALMSGEVLDATLDEMRFILPLFAFLQEKVKGKDASLISFYLGIIATLVFIKEEFGLDTIREWASNAGEKFTI